MKVKKSNCVPLVNPYIGQRVYGFKKSNSLFYSGTIYHIHKTKGITVKRDDKVSGSGVLINEYGSNGWICKSAYGRVSDVDDGTFDNGCDDGLLYMDSKIANWKNFLGIKTTPTKKSKDL